jgi:hypothetical protein
VCRVRPYWSCVHSCVMLRCREQFQEQLRVAVFVVAKLCPNDHYSIVEIKAVSGTSTLRVTNPISSNDN